MENEPRLTWSDSTLDECIDSLINEKPIAHMPIKEIDEAMGGVCEGRVVIFSGSPGCGKTSFMNMVATYLAKQGIPVFYLHYEMTEKALIAKSISYLSNETIKVSNFPAYKGTPELAAAIEEYRKISHLICHFDPIENDDELLDAVGRARLEKHATPVVIVDYLQLMPIRDRAYATEERSQIKDAMKDLRRVATNLGCPVFAISSINRTNYNKPSAGLDALAESSAIEYGADLIVHLTVPGSGKERAENLEKAIRPVNASILKNRYGPVGMVELEFVTEFAYFRKR